MPLPRLLTALLAGAGGLVVGILGTYAHLMVAGSARWPVGLVLAVALTGVSARLLQALRPPVPTQLAMVVGWFVAYGVGATRRSEGDLMIAGNLTGLLWLGLGVLVLVGALVLPGRAVDEPRPDREVRVTS